MVRGSEVAQNLAELGGSKESTSGAKQARRVLRGCFQHLSPLDTWQTPRPACRWHGKSSWGQRGGRAALQGDMGLSKEKCQVLPHRAALCSGTGWRIATGFSRLLFVATFGRLPFGWLASCLLGFSPVLCTHILNPAPSNSSARTNG